MSGSVIDLDRGVIINIHQSSGMNIYMYVDQPGVYLNAYGHEVSEKLAKEAGFNIEQYGKEKLRRDRMAKAMAAIDAELKDASATESKVVKDIDGFKIVDIGLGRHNVEGPDGELLTPAPIPLEQADLLLQHLVPAK